VDLNRNYDFKWARGSPGSSSGDPCSEDYRGAYPFSEKETSNIRDFVSRRP